MSRKKTISSAAASDESKAPVTAQPQDGAPTGQTGTDATPPAMNGAGGTNTPESSGDAASKAQADEVKPQAQTGTQIEPMVGATANSQPTPEAEASASGDTTLSVIEPSQGDAAGVGANAGPDGAASTAQEQATLFFMEIARQSRAESPEELLRFTLMGDAIFGAFPELRELPQTYPTFTRGDGFGLVQFDFASAGEASRRRFPVLSPVNFNNTRYDIGDPIDLTETEHSELPAGIVDAAWDAGEERLP